MKHIPKKQNRVHLRFINIKGLAEYDRHLDRELAAALTSYRYRKIYNSRKKENKNHLWQRLIKCANLETVKYFYKSGFKCPTNFDNDLNGHLWIYCKPGVFKFLLTQGVRLNNERLEKLRDICAMYKRYDLLDALIEKNIKLPDDYFLQLIKLELMQGSHTGLEKFINYVPAVLDDKQREEILRSYLMQGKIEGAQILLDNGVKIDANKVRYLGEDSLEVLQIMLTMGLDYKNYKFNRPLMDEQLTALKEKEKLEKSITMVIDGETYENIKDKGETVNLVDKFRRLISLTSFGSIFLNKKMDDLESKVKEPVKKNKI